eukprot:gene40837-43712_t
MHVFKHNHVDANGGAIEVADKHSAELRVERTLFYRNKALGNT